MGNHIHARRCFVLARLAIGLGLVFLATGCATPGLVTSNQTTIEQDFSVIAFSIDDSEWSEGNVWLRPKQLVLRHGDVLVPIQLKGPAAESQRILLEVPAQQISFDWYELDSGTGIFWKHYLSNISQSFQLTLGRVNYLGRIKIEDVEFDVVDDENRVQPVAIKVVFVDALKDDLDAWRQHYRIMQDHAPDELLAGQFANTEYQPVWVDEFYPEKPSRSGPGSGRKQPIRRNSSQSNRSRSRPQN